MIIWINGAFGAGKTQTAFHLHSRIPGSYVYDPEYAGYYLRKVIPPQLAESDFQNYAQWREINYMMLSYLHNAYNGVLIVPMTIVDRHIFDEIVGRLRNDGITVHHFTLCASAETLRKRLRGRGDGGRSWPARQIDRCILGLRHEAFGTHVDTEGLTIEEVAEKIAATAQIELLPDRRSMLGKKWDRIRNQIKHIHWFH